jgi:hypothetical protein
LLARGYKNRVLICDFMDAPIKQTFLQLLVPTNYDRHLIIDEPIHSVEDLLSQIDATDVVSWLRFHNILLALLCEKPIISMSFLPLADGCNGDVRVLPKYCGSGT